MAYTWQTKTVYYRETTDGKTKWVKIPGVRIRSSNYRTELFVEPEVWNKAHGKYMPPVDAYVAESIR